MEVFVCGSSQVAVGRWDDSGVCSFSRNLVNLGGANELKRSGFGCGLVNLCFSRSACGFSLRVSASASSQAQPLVSEKASKISETFPNESVKLFVGLPLDTVSISNKINHERAISVGLKALKLLGVDGVELPLWWGVVENEAQSKYDWTGYLAIVELLQKLGLKVQISLCFHGSQEAKIPLPQWVDKIGASNSDIYFKDRAGHHYKDSLSFAVDELPVLNGKTPLEVYEEFFGSFRSTFSPFFGSTITGVSVGLGPDGELKYPSVNGKNRNGGGEFQCYDKYMLENLKHHAEKTGNPLWGLGGPHDAPAYHLCPFYGGFFAENGGSWETPYGEFFLSWYSNQLIQHGDRMLSLAASTFKDAGVSLSGRIPLMHSTYKSRSHPSELTAGFYNTDSRDGYNAVAEMFSRHSCSVVVPGFDLSDEGQPRSNPEALLAQIISCCSKHGTEVSGQNSTISGRFEQMKKKLSAEVKMFTYQRMGAYFFSPEHFPVFTRFVRALSQPPESHESRWELSR